MSPNLEQMYVFFFEYQMALVAYIVYLLVLWVVFLELYEMVVYHDVIILIGTHEA